MNWNSLNLQPVLQAWASDHWVVPVSVMDVSDLGGHSGQTFGFRVEGDAIYEDLVIRLVAPTVPQRGGNDLRRQANLLRALHPVGPWISAVRDVGTESIFFGAAFLIVSRLDGKPLIMGPTGASSDLSDTDRQRAHCLAAETLAAIHAVEITQQLAEWDAPRSLADEIDFCTKLLTKSPDAGWLHEGMRLRDDLLRRRPQTTHIGLFHGDFQTNNVLFTGADATLKVSGVVDWEISGIGATELDLAWFLMMNDTLAWHPIEKRGGVDLKAVIAAYESHAKRRAQDIRWFWALACFRIAAIAVLNIRLHRNGKRIDEAWERASLSVPVMMARAFGLLNERSA